MVEFEYFLLSGLVVILGLCIGSFLNVCIYRIPIGESIVTGYSRCPKCKTRLGWLQKIPLLSFILLKGRCHNCHDRISLQYPLVELVTGILWLVLSIKPELLHAFMLNALLVSVLIVVAVIDFRYYLIPNKVMLFAISAWFGISLIFEKLSISNFLAANTVALSLFLVALIAKIILTKECMGMGDIKLVFLIGLFVGWPVFFVVIGGIMAGGLVGLIGLLTGCLRRDSRLPLGAFIAMAAISHTVMLKFELVK